MKVNVGSTSVCMDPEKVSVNEHWTGEISVAFGDQAFFFFPKNAVTLWRMLVGEKNSDKIPYKRCGLIETSKEVFVWYDGDTEEWTLRFADDYCVVMDADEALSIAWAVKRAVEESIFKRHYSDPPSRRRDVVYVLSSKRILTGDSAANGAEQIGGHEEVFASRSMAKDSVRAFMRPLVNAAYSESYWENSVRTVDDILDEILNQNNRSLDSTDCWSHDGQIQSFVVDLAPREVKV